MTTTTVQGSPQQEAFWREIEEGETHVLLEALAGTGKSFSIREAMRRTPEGCTAIYAAFNKHIADEFQRGLPEGCHAATLHSIGSAAIRRAWRDVTVDDQKVANLVKILIPGAAHHETRTTIARVVALAKGHGYGPDDRDKIDAMSDRFDLALGQGATREEGVILAGEILRKSDEDLETIDFADMVRFPTLHRLRPRQADILYIDEAQDLNRSQQKLCARICPTGRIIVVGDRHQAIYGFTGADTQSIANMGRALASTRRGLTTLPLTITRRCPRRVVQLAGRIVPALEAMHDAPEGSATSCLETTAIGEMQAGDMGLCRVNAPLVRVAFALIRSGKKAAIRGRDLSKPIVELARKVGGSTPAELIQRLAIYREAKADEMHAKGQKGSAIIDFIDRCDCLESVAKECQNIGDIGPRLSLIFGELDPAESITLSSIHRSKGLEADRVYILRPDLIPHPKAGQAWEHEQERNLAYVAATRAKRELRFAGEVPAIYRRQAQRITWID